MDSHVEQKARDAVRALEELRRAAFDACNGTEASPNAHEEFELAWSPTMSADELAEQALASATECLSEYQTFRLGCVYCYGCRSASCEHAQPSEPGQVFAGYQSTGRPYWEEFFNFLLAIDDERTDQLFASRPQILSRVVGRKRLTAEQLDSFGRDSLTYRIWGEVVAGYLDVDGTRMAMSVQVVENKAHQLRLQTVAPEGLHAALVDTPESSRSAFHRVHEALGEARNSLIEISHLWEAHHGRKRLREAREKVFSVLRHLAHSIERKGRQRIRRTAHAEQRGNEQRPVHAAWEDVAQAAKGDFYRDQFRNSIIVTGKSGRAHAFNDEGRHITSFVLQGDELDRRRQRNRYKPLDDAERNAFRQRVTQGEAEAPRQRPPGSASR